MNAIAEAARVLRESASQLEHLSASAYEPAHRDISLRDAQAKLRALLPAGKHFGITMELDSYENGMEIVWKVWDGKEFLTANSLADAVNAAIAKHAPKPQDALVLADQAIDPMPL